MPRNNQLKLGLLLCFSLPLAACQRETSTYTKIEAAHVDKVEGQEFSKVTLTEKAMERLAVATTPVREAEVSRSENKAARLVVPYGALIYASRGETFVYTSPQPRTFLRQKVDVDYIEGDLAVLNEGPPTGTEVVSVGTVELFGTELGVGH
jgi:hypothetical protein